MTKIIIANTKCTATLFSCSTKEGLINENQWTEIAHEENFADAVIVSIYNEDQTEEEVTTIYGELDLNKDLSKIPTVFTQELLTLLDEEPTLESTYELLPKNFGENQVKDNELIINLKEATETTPGYRIRILYPTIEDDNNVCTIQFEKSNILKTTKKAFQKASSIKTPQSFGTKL